MPPIISVVTPLYTRNPHRLRQCLDSLAAQSLQDIEFILSDGGLTTEACLNVCNEFLHKDERFKLARTTADGVGALYNAGLDLASGAYLGFLEPDDWAEPYMFEDLLDHARQSGADIVKSIMYARLERDDQPERFLSGVSIWYEYALITNKEELEKYTYGMPMLWNALYAMKFIRDNTIRFTDVHGAGTGGIGFLYKTFFYAQSFYFVSNLYVHMRVENRSTYTDNKELYAEYVLDELNALTEYMLQKNFPTLFWDIKIRQEIEKLSFNYFARKRKLPYLKKISLVCKRMIEAGRLTSRTFKSKKEREDYVFLADHPYKFFIDDIALQLRGYRRSKDSEEAHKITRFGIPFYKSLPAKTKPETINHPALVQTCLSIQALHNKTFPKYKYINEGRSVVMVGSGPTLKLYSPIQGACHIGINGAVFSKTIKLEYLFMEDYILPQAMLNKAAQYDCVKFFGTQIDRRRVNNNIETSLEGGIRMIFPEDFARKAGAERYYTYDYSPMPPEIFHDIENCAFPELHGTLYTALQFALYTHPEKIYLVGCDAVPNGYFFARRKDVHRDFTVHIERYILLKKFIKVYYPEIEIISINPIGLKGIFTDTYTPDFDEEEYRVK